MRCEGALAGVDGVTSVGVGGSGKDYRLLLATRDLASKTAARERTDGDVYDGLKILWTVTNTAPRGRRPARPL